MVVGRLLCRSASTLFKRTFVSSNIKMADQKFQEHEIVPDVLKIAPNQVLNVKYASGAEANQGNHLKPRQVKDQPDVSWKAEEKELYTLCLTDPDAPSRKEPAKREWHHWLVVNIPGSKVKEGNVISEYVGSGPPEGSGLHRYVLLAYKQPGKITADEKYRDKHTATGRANFRIQAFADKYNLGDPVAGNFYLAEWDDYVPELYKQLTA